MAANQEQITQLLEKLELLLKRQQIFNVEINELRREIQILKNEELAPSEPTSVSPPKNEEILPTSEEKHAIEEKQQPSRIQEVLPQREIKRSAKAKKASNWEKFVGENLINKVGIIITVIGVAIGAKYSIENNLISPLTRIVLGYLTGLGLLGFGIKLKPKYESYSAVLVSGALATLYLITFAAHSFYDLLPQLVAFVLMVLFTVFGVVASLNYNRQIIAHLGLVGAYAVPFLLSKESGNATVLFSYMAIINTGILIISYKKYWKSLFYSSFVFTWLIYISWATFSYNAEEHFLVAMVFITIFFLLFYMTFLAYKLSNSQKFKKWDIVLLLANSFIFYGLGYGLLRHHDTGKQLLGAFTLANAIIHFVVCAFIYQKKLADRNVFFLISGLVLTFITIAIPVQLDGNWVTLLWALEAAILFWIGRSKNVPIYEKLSYPLIALSFLSLLQDWDQSYNSFNRELISFLNPMFLTSVLFVLTFGWMNWIQHKSKLVLENSPIDLGKTIISIALPTILIIAIFGAFYLELDLYWNMLFEKSKVTMGSSGDDFQQNHYNYDLRDHGHIWKINYVLFFISALAFITIKRIKNRVLGIVTLTLAILSSLFFLSSGLYVLSELRESYLNQENSEYFTIGYLNMVMRYIAFAFLAVLMVAIYMLSKQPFMKIDFKVPFGILLHVTILWVASSELLNWLDISGVNNSYKLGLSILWGSYSLLLIALGIWKQRKYLRVMAIILFGITLIKLFLYDIASLNTISKTIVFVSLGILLLIISFLYNKYKDVITDETKK